MGLKNFIKGVGGLYMSGESVQRGGLYFEAAPRVESGVVIQWSVGPDAGRVDLADALLADATRPEQLQQMVGFCARKKLPVAVWLLSGVWCLPTDVDSVARWTLKLSESAGSADIWIDPFAMPAAYRRRLGAYLRRAGAHLGEPGAN